MFVKPLYAVLRDPVTRTPIPAEGIEVPDDDFFWLTMIRQGCVEVSEAPPPPPPEPEPAPAPAPEPAPEKPAEVEHQS